MIDIFTERRLQNHERPYDILQQWGIHKDEVRFYLRYLYPDQHRGKIVIREVQVWCFVYMFASRLTVTYRYRACQIGNQNF